MEFEELALIVYNSHSFAKRGWTKCLIGSYKIPAREAFFC